MKFTKNSRRGHGFFESIPKSIRVIMIICLVMHVMQIVMAHAPVYTVLESSGGDRFLLPSDPLSFALAIHGIGLSNWFFWTPVTYMFLHGSWAHLFLNMVGLYVFGSAVTYTAGERAMWTIFIASGIVGGVGWALASGLESAQPCIGASAGVLGLVGAYAVLRPRDKFIVFVPIPIPVTARTLAICMFVFNVVELYTLSESNVAYLAHLAGIVAGGLIAAYMLKRARRRARTAAPRVNPWR